MATLAGAAQRAHRLARCGQIAGVSTALKPLAAAEKSIAAFLKPAVAPDFSLGGGLYTGFGAGALGNQVPSLSA
jgi:hypothetical protein